MTQGPGQNALDNVIAAYVENRAAQMLSNDSSGDAESGRRYAFGNWRAQHQQKQGQKQLERGQHSLDRAAMFDPTLAAAVAQRDTLPPAAQMGRAENRSVSEIPDGYTDPTWLTVIPDQSLGIGAALSVTTPPPSTYFAAYMLLSVSGGAQALFSVSAITIGGVPMVQGAGAFGADALNPSSFNVAPVRRIIATSQPITISTTNNDIAARRVSSYFFGFLARTTLQNY